MAGTTDNVILGKPPPPHAGRDAVHVACVPVCSHEAVKPGQLVRLVPGRLDRVLTCHPADERAVGIVDPFLTVAAVEPETRFWLCLKPGTVTGLRHVWTHPGFATRSFGPPEPEAES